MDESACLKKLTTYQAFTLRKCPPRDPKKEPRGTWARSEVIEERLTQEDITKQIKKLDKGRSVTDKKKALAHNQQGQITNLVDNLASQERDRAFEWSLVQLDSVQKPVSLKGGRKGGLYETITMTAYVKRSPLRELNPVILFQNIEKIKADSMRPPPQPPQGGQLPQGVTQIFDLGAGRKGSKNRANGRVKSKDRRYHDHNDSSGSSFDSDTDSGSSYTGSDSMGTTISSKSRDGHRRPSHGRGAFRSHSRQRHRESRGPFYLEHSRSHSPEHNYDAYGGLSRPYVPDVPRVIPAVAALPPFDPVAAAYQAGKVDAEAERYGTAERVLTRPVERVIERVIEPRPVISYGRMESPRFPEHRYSESRYIDDRYIDDLRREDELRRRERETEEYIEGRLDGRRPSEYLERRHTDAFYERRPSEPIIWSSRSPFSPTPLPRRYPPSSINSGW